MKPEDQRIAIAEACGFDADFLNDLNAMHKVEKVLTADQRDTYIIWLARICPLGTFIFSTAAQRAEAFLKTLNLWKS